MKGVGSWHRKTSVLNKLIFVKVEEHWSRKAGNKSITYKLTDLGNELMSLYIIQRFNQQKQS